MKFNTELPAIYIIYFASMEYDFCNLLFQP
jgi:hypothetical protein